MPDISEFAEFADTIRGHRTRSEAVVRQALRRVSGRSSNAATTELVEVSHELLGTLITLDTAAEELRVQNEALFAARVELEGTAALFRDLFELAPSAYLVTNDETRILYANDGACTLLGASKNALVGKPLAAFVALEDRVSFRACVLRARECDAVCVWPTRLSPRGGPGPIDCRLRVRSVSPFQLQTAHTLYWNITEETDEDLF